MRIRANSLSEAYVKSLAVCNTEIQRRGMTKKAVSDLLNTSYNTTVSFLSMRLVNINLLDTLIIILQMKIIVYLENK